jgi:hypothetical protein
MKLLSLSFYLYLIGNGHGIAYGIGDEEEFLQKRIRLEDNDPARPVFFSSSRFPLPI